MNGKKPQTPPTRPRQIMILTGSPMSLNPHVVRCIDSNNIATVIIAVTPPHKPSSPSRRFNEFVAPKTKIITMEISTSSSSLSGREIFNDS